LCPFQWPIHENETKANQHPQFSVFRFTFSSDTPLGELIHPQGLEVFPFSFPQYGGIVREETFPFFQTLSLFFPLLPPKIFVTCRQVGCLRPKQVVHPPNHPRCQPSNPLTSLCKFPARLFDLPPRRFSHFLGYKLTPFYVSHIHPVAGLSFFFFFSMWALTGFLPPFLYTSGKLALFEVPFY